MKNKLILLVLLISTACFSIAARDGSKKISILGDSYSTYVGHVTPADNNCWYGKPDLQKVNDAHRVEDTWWYQLIEEQGLQLDHNNSYSGATICNTGYNQADFSDRSFITRLTNLGAPDIILIFGGTNDSWAKVPIGEFQYADWNKEQLYSFRPAFGYLLSRLKEVYPNAIIYNITNTELSREVAESMDTICNHYQVKNIKLTYIDKQSGHPSINGMKQICKQVSAGMK